LIGGRSEDDEVQKGGQPDERKSLAHHGLPQIDFRVYIQQFTFAPQAPSPNQHADGDQH
jgi:hypothetical protein